MEDEVITPEGASETNQEPEVNSEPQSETEINNPEPELFELPDGRKVSGEELSKEWKDNFMPDYTRKSQELAEYKRSIETEKKQDIPKWKQEDYRPETYAELIEIARQEAVESIRNQERESLAEKERISKEVENTLSKLKGVDSNLDENKLFEHAVKYGFKDLNLAYQNMSDMGKIQATIEKKVLGNIKSRENLKVATDGITKTITNDDSVDYFSINNETPQEALRRLKNN